jgi:hypothetical protein
MPRSLSQPTWEPLPKVMLRLLIQISEAERRLAARGAPPAGPSPPDTPDDESVS